MASDAQRARELLEAGVAGGDCGRLEEAITKSRVLIGPRHGLIVDAEAVLEEWVRRCGRVRADLVDAVRARCDLRQLVARIDAAEAHAHRRLMRSDLRRAKNLVVETEQAMNAIKPVLATQDAHAVEEFLQKYVHVLPSDVYSEVAFLRDEFANGTFPKSKAAALRLGSPAPPPRSPTIATAPHSRPTGYSGSVGRTPSPAGKGGGAVPTPTTVGSAITHPHYSPPRVHTNSLGSKVFTPLTANTLYASPGDPAKGRHHAQQQPQQPSPARHGSHAASPWAGGGGGAPLPTAGGTPSRAGVYGAGGPGHALTSPHPPATPDAEYMPAGMFESGRASAGLSPHSPASAGGAAHPPYHRYTSSSAGIAAATPPRAPLQQASPAVYQPSAQQQQQQQQQYQQHQQTPVGSGIRSTLRSQTVGGSGSIVRGAGGSAYFQPTPPRAMPSQASVQQSQPVPAFNMAGTPMRSAGSQQLPPRTPSASTPAAVSSLQRTPTSQRAGYAATPGSPALEDARHTERLRLYLHEINAREKVLRDERRECQVILKEMVGDLSTTKTLRLPVTPVTIEDGRALQAPVSDIPPLGGVPASEVFNITQPKNFPEEDMKIQQALLDLQAERQREERVRARQAVEAVCLLEQEQVLEYQTLKQYEGDAWFNVLRLCKLSEGQARVVHKARVELRQIEGKARSIIDDSETVEWSELEHRATLERGRVSIAYDRISQLQREDARVKTMEAKLEWRVAAGGTIPDEAPSPALVIPDPRMRETQELLAAMEKRAQAAEERNASLVQAVQQLHSEVDTLKTAVEVQEKEVPAVATAEWEHERATYEAKMAALEDQIAALRPAEKEVVELRQRMESERAALLKELSEEKEELKQHLDNVVSSQAAKLEEHTKQQRLLSALETEKAAKENELAAAQEEKTTRENELREMKAEAERNIALIKQLEDERSSKEQELAASRKQTEARAASFEEEKRELLLQLKEAKEELVKFQTGERQLPSLRLFVKGASEMIMDEQRGRYALWEDEFRTRSTQEVNTYRLLKTIHKTIQLTNVEEPAQRAVIEREELACKAALEQSPEIMDLFALLEETVSSCVDDDIETIASSLAEDM